MINCEWNPSSRDEALSWNDTKQHQYYCWCGLNMYICCNAPTKLEYQTSKNENQCRQLTSKCHHLVYTSLFACLLVQLWRAFLLRWRHLTWDFVMVFEIIQDLKLVKIGITENIHEQLSKFNIQLIQMMHGHDCRLRILRESNDVVQLVYALVIYPDNKLLICWACVTCNEHVCVLTLTHISCSDIRENVTILILILSDVEKLHTGGIHNISYSYSWYRMCTVYTDSQIVKKNRTALNNLDFTSTLQDYLKNISLY